MASQSMHNPKASLFLRGLHRILILDCVHCAVQCQIGTHFFGHAYLSSLLLPVLKESTPSRIVWTTSAAEAAGQVDWDNLAYAPHFLNPTPFASALACQAFWRPATATKATMKPPCCSPACTCSPYLTCDHKDTLASELYHMLDTHLPTMQHS